MEFARQVSNRVFFMDEGGIYEDGSPEQIFEHPLKEKTRRFIEKLKVFEVTIDSRDFDFMGLNTDLENYCNKQNISRNDCHKLQSVMEELCRIILLPVYEDPDIRCSIEYAEKTGHINITVEYCGTEYDPKNSNNELALSILKGTTSCMSYEYNAVDKYANKVKIEL
jgi:polar amino acid transport system ATP-binding protein